MRTIAAVLLVFGLLLLAAPVLAGGWVVITLENLPGELRAGEPVDLGFMVRQHGVRPVDGVNVVVNARHGASGEHLEWTAAKGAETGYFTVRAVFPEAGEWRWDVKAAPFPQVTALPPLNVMPAAAADTTENAAATSGVLLRVTGLGLLAIGAFVAVAQRRRPGLLLGLGGGLLLLLALIIAPQPAPAADAAPPVQSPHQAPAEVGAALFQAKGCVTCHQHGAVPESSGPHIGPDLTHYQPDPEFVRNWLRDPAALRPGTQMPNLGLDEAEIEALLAFLTDSRLPAPKVAGREACPVTGVADSHFVPPTPDPAGPLNEVFFWYGSLALRTHLVIDGVWHSLPHHEHGYTQKMAFWSEGYDWQEEQKPELVLTGRRLDGDETMTDSGASNAYHPDHGSMIMTAFVLPAAGCWEITADYGEERLSFVVWVEE